MSQRSNFYDGEFYKTTRRGRAAYGDIGEEMFPEKYEDSGFYEDPGQVAQMHRDTLRDFSPDTNSLLEQDRPRRRTYGRDRLNIADGGARTNTDPYMDEDYDTQFHDKDPRGWSTETPWREMRRIGTAHSQSLPYSSDADFSVTGGGTHPNAQRAAIRGAQTDLKARWKNFEEQKLNQHSGGVGTYANVSAVFSSSLEDPQFGGGILATMEDPEVRQRATSNLSNILHMGGNFLRANTTTDERVKTGGYAQLVQARGLLPAEQAYRFVEGDSEISRAAEKLDMNRTQMSLLATGLQTNGAMNRMTAVQAARIMLQGVAEAQYKMQDPKQGGNRRRAPLTDLLAIAGYQLDEVKKLEQQLSSPDGKMRRAAEMKLAEIHDMVDYMQSVPVSEQARVTDDMAMRSISKHADHVRSIAGVRPTSGNRHRHAGLYTDLVAKKSNSKTTGEISDDIARKNYTTKGPESTRDVLNAGLRQDFAARDTQVKRHGGSLGSKYTHRYVDREMEMDADT
jgi:hypothetical protein